MPYLLILRALHAIPHATSPYTKPFRPFFTIDALNTTIPTAAENTPLGSIIVDYTPYYDAFVKRYEKEAPTPLSSSLHRRSSPQDDETRFTPPYAVASSFHAVQTTPAYYENGKEMVCQTSPLYLTLSDNDRLFPVPPMVASLATPELREQHHATRLVSTLHTRQRSNKAAQNNMRHSASSNLPHVGINTLPHVPPQYPCPQSTFSAGRTYSHSLASALFQSTAIAALCTIQQPNLFLPRVRLQAPKICLGLYLIIGYLLDSDVGTIPTRYASFVVSCQQLQVDTLTDSLPSAHSVPRAINDDTSSKPSNSHPPPNEPAILTQDVNPSTHRLNVEEWGRREPSISRLTSVSLTPNPSKVSTSPRNTVASCFILRLALFLLVAQSSFHQFFTKHQTIQSSPNQSIHLRSIMGNLDSNAKRTPPRKNPSPFTKINRFTTGAGKKVPTVKPPPTDVDMDVASGMKIVTADPPEHIPGAAAPGFTFPPENIRVTAAASYRQKVLQGKLAVNQSEREQAKANAYEIWAPCPPQTKGKSAADVHKSDSPATSLARAAQAVRASTGQVQGRKDAAPSSPSRSVMTIGSSSSDESLLGLSKTTTEKKKIESDSTEDSDSATADKKPSLPDYDSLCDSTGTDERILLQHTPHLITKAAPTLANKEIIVSTSVGGDTAVQLKDGEASSSNVHTASVEGQGGRSTANHTSGQYEPSISGGSFFDDDTNTFFASLAAADGVDQQTKLRVQALIQAQSALHHEIYDPPLGSYTRHLSHPTTTYVSFCQLTDWLIQTVRASAEPLLCQANHAFSPFYLSLKDDSALEVYNCLDELVGVIGPKPNIYLEEPADLLSIHKYGFKDDARTSFYYPTYVLAQALQLAAYEHGNDSTCSAHPDYGPFRVATKGGVSWIFNSRHDPVWELPGLDDVADYSRPWMGILPNVSKGNQSKQQVSQQVQEEAKMQVRIQEAPTSASPTEVRDKQMDTGMKESSQMESDPNHAVSERPHTSEGLSQDEDVNDDTVMQNTVQEEVAVSQVDTTGTDGVSKQMDIDQAPDDGMQVEKEGTYGKDGGPSVSFATVTKKLSTPHKGSFKVKIPKGPNRITNYLSFGASPKNSDGTPQTAATTPPSEERVELESRMNTASEAPSAQAASVQPAILQEKFDAPTPPSGHEGNNGTIPQSSSNVPSPTNGSPAPQPSAQQPVSQGAASALKASSYTATPHNPVPAIPLPDLTPIHLGDCPQNTNKEKLICTLTVQPVEGKHPCDFTYDGFKEFALTASRFDSSMVICPLYGGNGGKIPEIKVGIPQSFPPNLDHMPAYIDVDESQLKRAFGTDAKGRKRKQGSVYCTFVINSTIEPRFLIKKLAPVMDRKGMNLQVKKLQQIRTKSHWALGAMSSEVDPVGLAEVLRMCFDHELKKAKTGTKLFAVDEVPDIVVTMKALRLVNINKKDHDKVTNLEFYAARLRRAPHIECSERDVPALDLLLAACEVSQILRKFVGRKVHVLYFQREGDFNFDKMAHRAKIEGHMSYQAMSATLPIKDVVDLHRRVQVVMAPLEDGTVPACPWKYTSVLREMTSFTNSDDRPLIDALIPSGSTTRSSYTTAVFKQCEESESFVTAFSHEPCAFLYYIMTVEKGYRDDCAISICKSFDIAARGRISSCKWDSENWVVETPFQTLSDTFVTELYDEGYRLSEHDKLPVPPEGISTIIAEQDLAQVQKELGLKTDEVTLASGLHGAASMVSGSNHTLGDTSQRTTDTQQFHRSMEEQCIANAQAMEAAAAAKWGTTSSLSQGSSHSPADFMQAVRTNNNAQATSDSSQLLSEPVPAPIHQPVQPLTDITNGTSSHVPHPPAQPTSVSTAQPPPPASTVHHSTDNTHPNSTSSITFTDVNVGSSPAATANDGEPASGKQSGLGRDPPESNEAGGAGGPRGPR